MPESSGSPAESSPMLVGLGRVILRSIGLRPSRVARPGRPDTFGFSDRSFRRYLESTGRAPALARKKGRLARLVQAAVGFSLVVAALGLLVFGLLGVAERFPMPVVLLVPGVSAWLVYNLYRRRAR